MERLTERTVAGVANLDYPDNCYFEGGQKDPVAASAFRQNAIERLAAYEDTGLTPEDVKEFKERLEHRFVFLLSKEWNMPPERLLKILYAERDGRLVVLPVVAKEGDPKPQCFYGDVGEGLCPGLCSDNRNDDEPIEMCKKCWYCSVGYRQMEAEAAVVPAEVEGVYAGLAGGGQKTERMIEMENVKMKAMLSQPMGGKTDEEIVATRERAIAALEAARYDVVNTLFTDEWYSKEKMAERGVVNIPLCFLAKSLESMSLCHAAYFCKGWRSARGCRIEHAAAIAYGVKIIYEDPSEAEDNAYAQAQEA